MVTMGGDFHYTNSNKWFTNLDILIDAINNRVNYEILALYNKYRLKILTCNYFIHHQHVI